jgi:hypothetical protein
MLHFLSCFDITENPKTNSKRASVEKCLKRYVPEMIKWMDKHVRNWNLYMDKVLNVTTLFYIFVLKNDLFKKYFILRVLIYARQVYKV